MADPGQAGKPVCKYGDQCYRKNPVHFEEFAHPGKDSPTATSGDSEDQPPAAKRSKLEDAGPSLECPHVYAKMAACPTAAFYLTKVRGIPDRYNSSDMAIGIRDILSSEMGDIIASAQFNYVFDIPWMIDQYPKEKRSTPLLIVHGEQREGLTRLKTEARPFPNVILFQAKLEMFGTHHSKMMLLAYSEGMRVVIHTANLIEKDWDQKTQGVWVSPVFSRSSGTSSSSLTSVSDTKDTGFKQDLLDYLSAYGGKALDEWKQRVRECDMSSARVRLIASVPGAHIGANMHKWGHMKLRKVLQECGPSGSEVDDQWPVVGQFSSIGSLGPSSHQWLCSEWLLSLSSIRRGSMAAAVHKYPNLQLVFPSVENVRNSLEGYMAGGSIPYAFKTSQKQPYLNGYMCQWKADRTGRSRASPHIKMYMRVSPDCTRLAWFLITSANLSKAAWGAMEKKGSQLKIRSYEIGVLFLPSDQSHTDTAFTLGSSPEEGSSGVVFQVPVDLPLTGYAKDDSPWIWNSRYTKPDSKGNIWTPS